MRVRYAERAFPTGRPALLYTLVRLQLQQVTAQGDGNGFGAVGRAELLQEPAQVFLDHRQADAE